MLDIYLVYWYVFGASVVSQIDGCPSRGPSPRRRKRRRTIVFYCFIVRLSKSERADVALLLTPEVVTPGQSMLPFAPPTKWLGDA